MQLRHSPLLLHRHSRAITANPPSRRAAPSPQLSRRNEKLLCADTACRCWVLPADHCLVKHRRQTPLAVVSLATSLIVHCPTRPRAHVSTHPQIVLRAPRAQQVPDLLICHLNEARLRTRPQSITHAPTATTSLLRGGLIGVSEAAGRGSCGDLCERSHFCLSP